MRESGKKTLLNLTYYGLVIVMVAMIISLFIGINNNNIAMWARVMTIIISVVLVLIVVYMVVSMYTDISAYPVGFILLATTVATVIVSFVYYSRLTPIDGILSLTNLNVFLFVAGNLILINLLTIAIYIVGLYIKQPNEPSNRRFTTSNK